MPEMNGEKLSSAIKEFAPDQPIMMLTGFGGLMMDNGEIPQDVDLLVSKPVTLHDLRLALRGVLSKVNSAA